MKLRVDPLSGMPVLEPEKSVQIFSSSSGGGGVRTVTSGGGGISRTISSVAAPTTAGAAATTDYVYLVSGTTTLTLPTAIGNNNLYSVKNTGVNTVTIATTLTQTIDGSASATLPVANTAVDLISDNANWQVI